MHPYCLWWCPEFKLEARNSVMYTGGMGDHPSDVCLRESIYSQGILNPIWCRYEKRGERWAVWTHTGNRRVQIAWELELKVLPLLILSFDLEKRFEGTKLELNEQAVIPLFQPDTVQVIAFGKDDVEFLMRSSEFT